MENKNIPLSLIPLKLFNCTHQKERYERERYIFILHTSPSYTSLNFAIIDDRNQRGRDIFFVRGAVKQNRLNRGDIRDPRIPGTTRDTGEVKFDDKGNAIDQGTPGWVTLNLRGGVQVSEYNRLTLALENLFDKRYREHGTGVDASGFNIIVSLDNQF